VVMGSNHRVWISLTGGLGNQLFQLAAAYSLDPSEIVLESRFGMPRRTKNIPDILYFEFPEKIKWGKDDPEPLFFRKVVGFLLRVGIKPRKFEKYRLVKIFALIISKVLISFRVGKNVEIVTANDVGYSPIQTTSDNIFLIGYFQSWRFAELPKVRDFLNSLTLKEMSPLLIEHERLALEELPLVVHVRLGDYRLENDFGLLSPRYYESILEMWSSGAYKRLWLFSDEPSEALELIPANLREHARVIDDKSETPCVTLELMRLGYGYVIANSSLSWWGAMLSRTENPIVMAPQPWFKSMDEPKDLIPAIWQRKFGF
jgi:hypothetical protein